jgi:hypothetical protein
MCQEAEITANQNVGNSQVTVLGKINNQFRIAEFVVSGRLVGFATRHSATNPFEINPLLLARHLR